MKKIVLCILISMISILICACGGGTVKETMATVAAPSPVTLTESNIEQYLNFSMRISDADVSNTMGMNFSAANVSLKVYQTTAGSLSNVNVTVRPVLDVSFLRPEDGFKISGEKSLDYSFMVPASGNYEDEYRIIASMCNKRLSNGNCGVEIVSVSGTFTPSN